MHVSFLKFCLCYYGFVHNSLLQTFSLKWARENEGDRSWGCEERMRKKEQKKWISEIEVDREREEEGKRERERDRERDRETERSQRQTS